MALWLLLLSLAFSMEPEQQLLKEVFSGQFDKEFLSGLKEPSPGDLAKLMSPEQKAGARARLDELSSQTDDPRRQEELARGYQALHNLGDFEGASAAAKDRAAYALWLLSKDRVGSSMKLPASPFGSAGGASQGSSGMAGPSPVTAAARSVLGNMPAPPAPTDDGGPEDGKLARTAFTAAAGATGALLLFAGLGGAKLEEKLPNIRRNFGIGAGLAAVTAAGLYTAATAGPAITLAPPALPYVAKQAERGKAAAERALTAFQGFSRAGAPTSQLAAAAPAQAQAAITASQRVVQLVEPAGRLIGRAG